MSSVNQGFTLKSNSLYNVHLINIISYLIDANSAFVFLSTKLYIYLYAFDGGNP
jgi:hypothetical protein